MPDRTNETHLNSLEDQIKSAACLGSVEIGCAEVLILVDEQVVASLGHQGKRCSVLHGRRRSFTSPVPRWSQIGSRLAAAMFVDASSLAENASQCPNLGMSPGRGIAGVAVVKSAVASSTSPVVTSISAGASRSVWTFV